MSNLKSILVDAKAILQLFFRRRRKLVFGLALYRILEQANEQVSETDRDCISLDSKSRDCWICWEKEKLFSSTRKTFKGSAQKGCDDGEKEINNCNAKTRRDSSSLDVIWLWKLVEQWFDTGAENEVGGTLNKPEMFEDDDENLTGGDDGWKNIFVDVVKKLETCTQELGVISQETYKLAGKPEYCSFALKTYVDTNNLTKKFPIGYLHKNPANDETDLIAVDICQKCLEQVSFNECSNNETVCQKFHCISQLIAHLSALCTQCKSQSGAKMQQGAKDLSSQKSMPTLGRNRIQITVVRNKSNAKSTLLKPRDVRSVSTPARANFPCVPVTVSPRSNTSGSFNSSGTVGFRRISESVWPNIAALAPSTVSKPSYFKFPVKQEQFKLANLRVLKVIKTSNSTANSANQYATVSNSRSSVYLCKNNTFSKVKPFKMVSAKPLTTLCPNTAIPKGKVMKIFPRIKCVNRQVLPIIHPAPLRKWSKPLVVESQKNSSIDAVEQSQSNKRKKTGSSGNARKKIKKENPARDSASSIPNTTSLKHVSASNSTAKLSDENTKATSKRDGKQKSRTSGGKLQVRIKTTNKKKATERQSPSKKKIEKLVDAVPMKAIVGNFIATSNNENGSTSISSTNVNRRRSKPRSAKKLIPVPYEAHYLCIYETLAKKSWKAYWYQKCRCARGEKKKTENTSQGPVDPVQNECAPSAPVLKKEFGSEETSAIENCEVQNEILTEKNACATEVNNRNNNSSKTADVSNCIDHCVSSFRLSPEGKSDKVGSCSSENRSRKLSSKKDELAKAFRRMLAHSKRKKLAKSEFKKGDVSREMAKAEFGTNGKSFKKSVSTADSFAAYSALTLPTLTMKDVEFAISQLDENALFKFNDCAAPNANVAKTSVVKPKLISAKKYPQTAAIKAPASNIHVKKSTILKSNVASKDSQSRQEKVNAVVQCLMQQSESCDFVDRVLSSHVFAQCFEDIDKQPGCLDLISVNPSIFKDSPELFGKVSEVHKLKESRKSFLLKPAKLSIDSGPSKVHANDLDCIWAFGKPNGFFSENPVCNSHVKTKKTKFRKHPAAKKSTRCSKPYLTFKRSMKKFSRNKNPKKKVYRHHSRRPKADIPLQRHRKVLNSPKQEDNDIGIEPYILQWDIPKISCSKVVGKLESVWGELTGFAGLNGERLPVSIGTVLTRDRVIHALTAIKDSSEIFTFSSKPKDGKNTVLLICRKVKQTSEEGLQAERGEVVTNSLSPNTTFCDIMSDVSNPGSSKLLLKLKKTGEVSGSAIYSVSDSDEIQDELESSDQESDDDELLKRSNKNFGKVYADFQEKHSQCARANPANQNDLRPKPLFNLIEDQKFGNLPKKDLTNSDKFLLQFSKKSSDHLVSSRISLDSSPLRTCQDSLESDFDQSCSEIDIGDVGDVMHSTMLDESPKREKVFENGCTKYMKLSDLALPFVEVEEGGLRVVDWDGKLEGKDCLEELLLSINEKSLDILEQTFVADGDLSISPSKLQCLLKLKEKNSFKNTVDTISSVEHSYTSIYLNSTHLYLDKKSNCDQSSTSSYQFQENFSSFDSPEAVRGNSHSKATEDIAVPPLSESLNGNITRTPVESMNCSRDESQEKNDKNSGKANSIMKSCNVLLEPLEGMLEDIQRNGSQKNGAESSNPSPQIRFTESSVRELNRLLKNRALNGAYWRNVDVESNSSASSSSSSRWCFRGRNKKKDEVPSVEIDLEKNVESEEDWIEIEEAIQEEPEIRCSKRKHFGRVTYYRPLESELKRHFSKIFIKPYAIDNVGSSGPKVRDQSSVGKHKALMHLLPSDMNFAQVRQWIVDSTLSHPPPLRCPVFFPRKANTSKRPPQSKTNVREVDASCDSALNENVEKLTPKKIKKSYTALDASRSADEDIETPPPKRIKKNNAEKLQNSSKSTDGEEFNNLRRQLFRLRHPNYKGDICPGEEVRPLEFDPPACRAPLKLIRVSAEEAKKQNASSLSSDILLRYKPSVNSATTLKRRRSQASASSSNNSEVAYSHITVPLVKVPQASLDSILNVSSRGRAIKPSLRNQPLDFEPSNSKKRRRSEDIKVTQSPPPAPKPDFCRPRSRFVNKHSSSGLFIKKIIESGLYE